LTILSFDYICDWVAFRVVWPEEVLEQSKRDIDHAQEPYVVIFFDVFSVFRLYEHLMEKTGQSRRDVKVGLLRDVFGKRGQYPSVVEQSFRESFPGLWSFVRQFNRDDHGALLKELQRVESKLVIHEVGNQLSRSGVGPCVSLHDSMFCRRDDLDEVKSAFTRQFEAMDFGLRLKVA